MVRFEVVLLIGAVTVWFLNDWVVVNSPLKAMASLMRANWLIPQNGGSF